ncbi:GNAT family N-acetyltransferase [Croceicoccus ponticola]|uniref:GNAT family N-acetyltransferase n=1 Tax=Croceicoccus ponticola TaxID=2217664 RepID=UPI0013E29D3C|nr:GNAT family protein [Croceicoccus ponticola]
MSGLRPTNGVIATTDRLVLRTLRVDDIPALFKGFGDPGVMTWWSREAFADEAELAAYLVPVDATESLVCVAADPATDEAMLYCTAMPRARGQVELGYLCLSQWQGRGLVAEALTALIDHVFASGDIRRIYADTDPDNDASNCLLERLGFTLEGCLRENWFTHIGARDSKIWGLLAREWRAND